MAYVGNLVDGIVAAELVEGARGRGYWIADATPYTVTEIVETVGRALSDEGLEVTPNSTRLPVLAARVAETADRVLQAVGLYQQQLHVLGEMGHTIACDVSRSVDELGWEPRVALYEGMRNSIRWCLAQGLEL
jgi:nucleoside-diphosphate-sugar epimerase